MPSSTPVHAVVHARMSSTRLPGKVLRQIHGIPLLGHLMDRLEHCVELDGIIIATSAEPEDDAIASYAVARKIPCFRGDLHDVAGRVIEAARRHGIEHLVRISGDSPMLDPTIVTQALTVYRQEQYDLVTNVQQRTFPKGQSVEIFAREVLAAAWRKGMSAADREHVTTWFYRNPGTYRINNIVYSGLRGDVKLSVDTEQDMVRFEQMLDRLGAPYWQHRLETLLKTFDALTRTDNEKT
jgi:spore coat polysaccharide biosynthesis protein SpsF